MATDQRSADEIRGQMARIRRELHEDIEGVVAGAEAASDWKYYVKRYPWTALGLAAIAGYLIVPKRRASAAETAEEAVERLGGLFRRGRSAIDIEAASQAPPTPMEKERKSGLIGTAFGVVTPVALRVAQSYAANYLESWLARQHAFGLGPMPVGRPESAPGPRPNSPRSTGPRPGGQPQPGPVRPPGPTGWGEPY